MAYRIIDFLDGPQLMKGESDTMLTIDDKLPSITVAVQRGGDLSGETLDLGASNGRWKILFFWPKNFTAVCPTDIVGYGQLQKSFDERGADLIGASTDTAPMHLAWRKSDRNLAACDFPWIADDKCELAKAMGIHDPVEGLARRATFIVDPDNAIQHVTVNAKIVGRNPEEILRVLDALLTGEECPCNWVPGDEFVTPV